MMNIENTLILIPLLVGPIFVVAGLFLWLKPPKKISQIYGYRSSRSMKSQEAWDFSQPRAGKQMVYFGWAYLSTLLLGFLFPETSEGMGTAISMALLIIGVFLLFRRMENELKKKFG